MRLLLIADTYVPARISGALQMRDLAVELARQGHRPAVLTPACGPGPRVQLEQLDGVEVLRIRAPRTKDVPLVKRAISETLLPWVLLRGLRASPLRAERWDGVVWYSPTIFLGPLVARLNARHKCRSYLIVRDLFPDWAVDAGVMRKGLAYRFFKAVERYQYRQADVIGVQTPANIPLVAASAPAGARVEVLHNWLAPVPDGASTELSLGRLEGRIIFVYAGNMGVAQDLDAFVELARRMDDCADAGFLFVGRGSEVPRLRTLAKDMANVLFMEEVESSLIPGLLRKCHVGIVALDPRHGTHNIPGKFVAYMRAGLPVLARLNAGNDLHQLIEEAGVGRSVEGASLALLHAHAMHLIEDAAQREAMGVAGMLLAERMFTPTSAAFQVVQALRSSTGDG